MPDPNSEITPQDSFVPPKPQLAPSKSLHFDFKEEVTFENFDKFAQSLIAEPIVRSNCKLCTHRLRREVEEMFARDPNYLKMHRFLLEKGVDISYVATRRHLANHYKQQETEEMIKDYAESIKTWSKIQQEQEDRIKHYIAILNRRVHLLEAVTSDSDPAEMRKTAEAVIKLMDQIGKEEERLEKLKIGESPVTILMYKFEEIIKIRVEGVTSPEVKSILLEILEELSRTVKEIDHAS